MSKAATSLFVYGIYLIIIGLGFLLIPNTILGIFGMPSTPGPWIQVMAMLLLILAYYDIQAARSELIAFFRFSVHVRASVIIFFIAFVAVGIAEPILILFGVIDLSAAIWTALALRADANQNA
jgi:hypothetical protein